jgi:predicted transcriptional regulator
MVINVANENLNFFEALASETRLKIIQRLTEGDFNIKELAEHLHVSSASITKHIKKLESAGIVKSHFAKKNGAVQKVCTILNYEILLLMPKFSQVRQCHIAKIPVGLYSNFDVKPTCGLANEKSGIGHYDDPRSFLDSERVTAQILWFGQGYVEYQFANYLITNQIPSEIEISFEISSEAPGFNSNWPSDIAFQLNGFNLCQWTSPGEFGSHQGVLTPSWWNLGQYGMLKTIMINHNGVFLDEEKQSNLTIDDLDLSSKRWNLKFEVPNDAKNVGGLTLFGKGFGNYQQDIMVRTYYINDLNPV